MSIPSSRPNMTSIAAACILSGGLIAAAIIDSHKPVTVFGIHTSIAAEATRAAPPYSQETVATQMEAQLLAAPQLHDLDYKDSTCHLIAAKAEFIQYVSERGEFYVTLNLKWKAEGMRTTFEPGSSVKTHLWSGGSSEPPATGRLMLSNDGYGHYFGTFNPDKNLEKRLGPLPSVTVTVR